MTTGALAGLRILDLTRVLAGPSCTQILGDLGADVLKIEHPQRGDDTRRWGPPYLEDSDGRETAESAYYLSANRNKRSVTLDFTQGEGRTLLRGLLAHCDVLIENFKTGDLARHRLGWNDLKAAFPGLVYCSITGFGQDGPYAGRPGYDSLIQGMGGLMSVTGDPEGPPMKVGTAISDITAGMYATVAILAALRHRDRTGEGQHIDISLFDAQVGSLYNQAMNYLVGGEAPQRLGNLHPNVAPCDVYETADGAITLAIGNSEQFRRLCARLGAAEVADDPRFADNSGRRRHIAALNDLMRPLFRERSREDWLAAFAEEGIPAGPINSIPEVFADPHVRHRGLRVDLPHAAAAGGVLPMVASPMKFSATPPDYRRPPPTRGEHTAEVLGELLGLGADDCAALKAKKVI